MSAAVKLELIEKNGNVLGTRSEDELTPLEKAHNNWWVREGFLAMASTKNGEPIYRPTATILFGAGFIILCFAAVFIIGRLTGFEAGRQETEIQTIKEDLKKADAKAEDAKAFGIKNAERKAQETKKEKEKK